MRDERNGATAARRDARLEVWLGRTLGWGTVLATVLLAVGLLSGLVGIGSPSSLANAGLMVLMATPVARVVISVVEYARQEDWMFLGLTLAVLGMLAVSFVVGAG